MILVRKTKGGSKDQSMRKEEQLRDSDHLRGEGVSDSCETTGSGIKWPNSVLQVLGAQEYVFDNEPSVTAPYTTFSTICTNEGSLNFFHG